MQVELGGQPGGLPGVLERLVRAALTAMRDSALLKTFYAYGLRRREMCGLDLSDLRRNPKMPDFGRYGALFVRWGKSSNGSPPKRRTVFTIPEMDWIVGVLDHYLTDVRPRFEAGNHPALWVSERCGRLSKGGGVAAELAGQERGVGLAAEPGQRPVAALIAGEQFFERAGAQGPAGPGEPGGVQRGSLGCSGEDPITASGIRAVRFSPRAEWFGSPHPSSPAGSNDSGSLRVER